MTGLTFDGSPGDIEFVTLAERPDLVDAMWATTDQVWPRFMLHDPIADRYYTRVHDDLADTCLLALRDGEVLARAFFLPFAHDGELRDDLDGLPDRGWDAIVERGVDDFDAGRTPTAASALEIGIPEPNRGRGLSHVMVAAMRAAVQARGLRDLVAPVRPSHKHLEPRTSMVEYVGRTTDEGLPADPWLRVHARAGASIVRVAPASMTISGSLDDWRTWTGMAFDDGDLQPDSTVDVPMALAPVAVDADTATAVYVEPNVWMHHELA